MPVPSYLKDPPPPRTDFVWHKLEARAVEFKRHWWREIAAVLTAEDIQQEFVEGLFLDPDWCSLYQTTY